MDVFLNDFLIIIQNETVLADSKKFPSTNSSYKLWF